MKKTYQIQILKYKNQRGEDVFYAQKYSNQGSVIGVEVKVLNVEASSEEEAISSAVWKFEEEGK